MNDKRKYWITADYISPKVTDFKPSDTTSVSRGISPFVFGEIVAFFVGPYQKENAQKYIDMMEDAS